MAVKLIFRYLIETRNLGIFYLRGVTFDLKGYFDADYVGCKVDHKSTSGTCQFLGQSLVSWFSKKQNSIALSSTSGMYCGRRKLLCSSALDKTVNVGL